MLVAITAALALYCFLVAAFMTLFVASSRGDQALKEHFAESRTPSKTKRVG